MSKQPVDLTPLQKDYAVYLPAISSFYSTYVAKQRLSDFVPKDRIPKGFDRGIEGMNFLNADQGYFTYKYALYSAGHAQLDLEKSMTQESMIQDRDRPNTMILGDSGGYQIGKGVLKFDWLNFEGVEATKTRQKLLEWLDLDNKTIDIYDVTEFIPYPKKVDFNLKEESLKLKKLVWNLIQDPNNLIPNPNINRVLPMLETIKRTINIRDTFIFFKLLC